ncbi:MAG: hypothetical protein KIT11_11845 [Fimbriimonadaceae bacterium]|nr:hypothetical protein [Fimbriimonadaceae bacterium]QYK55273.1 MAG: hypothetical protein KF733_09690 [Fimbriimonadaceae bacterium]
MRPYRLLVLFLLLTAFGCQGPTPELPSEPPAAVGNGRIAFLLDDLGLPFQAYVAGVWDDGPPEKLKPLDFQWPKPVVQGRLLGREDLASRDRQWVGAGEVRTKFRTRSGITGETTFALAADGASARVEWSLRRDGPLKVSLAKADLTDLAEHGLAATPGPLERDEEKSLGALVRSARASSRGTLSFPPRLAGVVPELPKIVIDGPADDQVAVDSFVRSLATLSPLVPGEPVGPFGLTSDRYGGRQFWDADAFILPGALFLLPDLARQVTAYRVERMGQAEKNFDEWLRTRNLHGKPGLAERFQPARAARGLMFPWESGRKGDEQAPGDARNQHHLTGTVGFWLWQASALGYVEATEAERAVRGAAEFYRQRAVMQGESFGILGTMSPDEFAKAADNDLYTNLVAHWCLRQAFPEFAFQPVLPAKGGVFLTYDGDKVTTYKQAAAILAVWPLQNPAAEAQAVPMLDRFAGKSTPNGPAMSRSVEAIARARFGDPDWAYQEWRYGWQPYTQNSLLLFSEAPNGKNTVFLTGAAGCLNTVLYGFLGLRIDDQPLAGAAWTRQLRNGMVLSCKPRLPRAWSLVTVSPFWLDGKRYELKADHAGATLDKLGEP